MRRRLSARASLLPSLTGRRWDELELRLSGWVVLVVISALVLISAYLRSRALHVHFWVDEGLSVGIASHPLSKIPALMRQDGSPPLYYLLLHIWMSVFGRSEFDTHLLSLAFALLAIPVAYWAGAGLFDRQTGLICAVLAAGAPYQTTYAQETRMYSLLALLSIIVVASFIHAFVLRRRAYLPVFAVSLAAGLYTHNWALFLGLACAVAYLTCVWQSPVDRRAMWRDGAIAFGAVAVLFAPWLPTVIYQAQHTGAPWDLPPVFWSLTQSAYFLVGGRGAAVALLFGGGAGLLALRHVDESSRWLRTAAISALVLGVGTLLIAWAYSKASPAWAPRYLAVIVGPLIVAFGLGLGRAGRTGLVALALVACFWVLDPVPTGINYKSNLGTAVAKVRHHVGAGALVLSTQPEDVPTIAYYLPGQARYGSPLGPSPDARVVDWRNALARLRRSSVTGTLMPMLDALRPGQRVVLVVPLALPSSPLWMKLINRDSARWTRALQSDPTLRKVASSATGQYSTGLPVRVTVFVRRQRAA
ncbi:MAG: glycosyltransferase family 39 protein [Solirubrobacteraceae bacterium]